MTELLTLSFHTHHLPISLTTRGCSFTSSEQKIRDWQGTPAGVALADFVRNLVVFGKWGHVDRVLWGKISEDWSKVVVLLGKWLAPSIYLHPSTCMDSNGRL
jgi:hypothetical protein